MNTPNDGPGTAAYPDRVAASSHFLSSPMYATWISPDSK